MRKIDNLRQDWPERLLAANEDLLYSNKNFITVEEELPQYDDIFKLTIENQKEQQDFESRREVTGFKIRGKYLTRHKFTNLLKSVSP